MVSAILVPPNWLKYPKEFREEFVCKTKPTSNVEWDYYYLKKKHEGVFWKDRLNDVDSNQALYQDDFANTIEFLNEYRKSKGLCELKFSRKLSLQAELTSFYMEEHNCIEGGINIHLTHTLKSKLFYALEEREETTEANIDFEKNISTRFEIIGTYSPPPSFSTLISDNKNKFDKEALQYNLKYSNIILFFISAPHHKILLENRINSIGMYKKMISNDFYSIVIVFGIDENLKPEPEITIANKYFTDYGKKAFRIMKEMHKYRYDKKVSSDYKWF